MKVDFDRLSFEVGSEIFEWFFCTSLFIFIEVGTGYSANICTAEFEGGWGTYSKVIHTHTDVVVTSSFTAVQKVILYFPESIKEGSL